MEFSGGDKGPATPGLGTTRGRSDHSEEPAAPGVVHGRSSEVTLSCLLRNDPPYYPKPPESRLGAGLSTFTRVPQEFKSRLRAP